MYFFRSPSVGVFKCAIAFAAPGRNHWLHKSAALGGDGLASDAFTRIDRMPVVMLPLPVLLIAHLQALDSQQWRAR